MTMTDEVPVTPADRDAAENYLRSLHEEWHSGIEGYWRGERIAVGEVDDDPLVQSFARHRIASEQSRVGETVDALRDIAPRSYLYQFTDPVSGRPVWRNDAGPWNGRTPEATEALYSVEQIATLRASQPTPAEGNKVVDTQEERLAEALAVIAYEQPEEPWRVAHDALKGTARPLSTQCSGDTQELGEAVRHLLYVGEFCRTDETESALGRVRLALTKLDSHLGEMK